MSLTSGLFNPKNRFGFHKAFLQAQSADFADRHKAPCYIPTRLEVYRMPIAELQPILQNWFSHAPVELAPSTQQRKAVVDLLRMRSDREQIAPVIDALSQAG